MFRSSARLRGRHRRPTALRFLPSAALLGLGLALAAVAARDGAARSRAAGAFFEDVSVEAGIKPEALPPGSIGHPRAQVADINGDGWDDLLAHNMFPNVRAGKERFEHLVYLNNGRGAFRDYSAASGLRDVQAAFFAFADWDADGDLDAFGGLDFAEHPDGDVTNVILLNNGRGRFSPLEDSGVEAAVGQSGGKPFFAVGNASVGDFDGDAVADLYLGQGQTSYAAPDQLFRGLGDGRFEEVSDRLQGNDERPSNGSMACDVDNDGDQDILVAVYGVSNRGAQDFLWINDGQGGFTDQGVARGIASLPGGNYWRKDLDNGRMPEPGKGPGAYIGGNGFGVDCGDVDADGDIDLLVANISHPTEFPESDTRIPPEQREPLNYSRRWSDPSTLFINGGEAAAWGFENVWLDRGLPYNEGDIDSAMADLDLDGRLDIAMSRDKKYDASYSGWDQKGWFGVFLQQADGRFKSVGKDSGINYAKDPTNAERMRGSGNINWTDYDKDGDLDLWVGGGPGTVSGHLFKNLTVEQKGPAAHWLALRTVGDGKKVNRDGFGTRVILRSDGGGEILAMREQKSSRGTYNSTDTRVLHLGLGDAADGYTVEVRWPDGTVQNFTDKELPSGHYATLYNDGKPVVEGRRQGVVLPWLGMGR